MSQFNVRTVVLDEPKESEAFMKQYIHCDDAGAVLMSRKGGQIAIVVENLRVPACSILKQTMLSLGGDAAVHRNVLIHAVDRSSVLLMGTLSQMKRLVKKIKPQDFGLAILSEELNEVLEAPKPRSQRVMPYRGGMLEFGKKTLIMGILNCTPDSFSDGGKWYDTQKAIDHALEMEQDGADIIDIGGESTRPGSDEVSAEEEMKRVIPVIEALAGKLSIPISIDSYKAVTAEKALEAGAHIINDVWGFQRDPEMAKVAAKFQCPSIVMHNKTEAVYDDFMSEMMAFLRHSIELGVEAGLPKSQMIVDPGFGFGKEMEHNLTLTAKLKELSATGCPILMAASRKKTLGLILDAPADQRIEGDAAITAMSILNGADMVRVHDVKEMVKVAKVADAVAAADY